MMPRAAGSKESPHQHSSVHEHVALLGALAFALINTETLDRGKPRDALVSPEALARWWERLGARYPEQCQLEGIAAPPAWTSELLEAIKMLRRALRALITQVIEQQAVVEEQLQPVNAILALASAALERTEAGSIKEVTRLRHPEQGNVLVPIARSAVHLFAEADWQRIHQCRHDRCIVFFYDTTKSGTRRWCSPGCMNRARSIQHYRLAKQQANQE